MGYNQELFNLLKSINLKDKSIVELGSQDIFLHIEDINAIILSYGGTPRNLDKYISDDYSRVSSKYFYLNIGIKEYVCIDIDGRHSSLKYDLNFNIQEKYEYMNQYDIVTNIGTTEHIFNQKSCFENIHNLCKKDGLMIHLLPINGYENHCFFNYHSSFFEHLAEVNGYKIKYLDYYKTSYYIKDDSEYILIILQKIKEKSFNIPTQNKLNQKRFYINDFNNLFEQRFKLLTNLNLREIDNIAIFGTEIAASQAYAFALKINKKIVCFIDEYKRGNYKDTNIPIVSFEEFKSDYQDKTDIVFQGNKQRGNISERKGLYKFVFEVSNLIF